MAASIVHVATARLFARGGQSVSEASTAFQWSAVTAYRPKAGWGVKISCGGLTEIFTMRYSGNSVKRATSTPPPYHQGQPPVLFMRPPCRGALQVPDSLSGRTRSGPEAASLPLRT